MKEILVTITQRGQVTIPAEVRRLLGVKARDKVAFAIEDGQVRLRPLQFTLESAYGSVRPYQKPEDFKERIRQAMEEHATEVMRDLQRK